MEEILHHLECINLVNNGINYLPLGARCRMSSINSITPSKLNSKLLNFRGARVLLNAALNERLAFHREAGSCEKKTSFSAVTPPKFNITPGKQWLEDEFPFGMAYFQGLC